ncbi:MAG: hypothetical protein ACERJ1_08850 [Halodesulfovibrio sp.]|uniref:hypothetical protein n=1 Tax=Halodesulfovibrio sp. TaxID=1912772 RepID=UPI00359E5499
MRINFFSKFRKSKKTKADINLSSIFLLAQFSPLDIADDVFPRPICMESKGVFAHRLVFLVDDSSLERLWVLIKQNGFDCANDTTDGVVTNSESSFSLFIKKEKDFGGTLIRMVTNHNVLIEAILALRLSPPRPEISFPELEPDSIGSLQGSLEYWWYELWKPYWCSLSPVEQEQQKLLAEWCEFIAWH